MCKKRHEPLHQVEVVLEADVFEVLEKCGLMEGHKARSEQRGIPKVWVVGLLLNEGPEIGQVDLLQQRKDETRPARAMKLGKEYDHD